MWHNSQPLKLSLPPRYGSSEKVVEFSDPAVVGGCVVAVLLLGNPWQPAVLHSIECKSLHKEFPADSQVEFGRLYFFIPSGPVVVIAV